MTYLKGLLHKQNDKAPNLYYIRGKSDFDPEKLFFEIFVSDSQFSCSNRSNAMKNRLLATFVFEIQKITSLQLFENQDFRPFLVTISQVNFEAPTRITKLQVH